MTAEYAHHPQFSEGVTGVPASSEDGTTDAFGDPGGRGRRRRWRFAPSSITGRLVAGVVALVVVLVFATGAVTYFALRSFLYARLDQQLQSTASDPNALGRLFNNRGPFIGGLKAQRVWGIALSSDGSILTAPPVGATVETLDLSASDRDSIAANVTSHPRTIRTADGLVLRVTCRSVPVINNSTGETQTAIAVIGLSTQDVGKTLNRLVLLEVAIGASAVLLALGATAYGVRFSLRHLYGVTRTAHEVAAELSPQGTGLDRRVEVVERDTEVGRLAESMNTLLSAVETQFAARVASEERMRQFLADASHELRTPLTSIRGYAELGRLQRAQGHESDATNLDRIEFEGKRMSRLVDDLLTLARSDQAVQHEEAVQHEAVDVGELLADAVDGIRAAYPARGIAVSAPPGLMVSGDPHALLRVVSNLVTNAAIHTRPDGPIEARAFRDGDWAVVQVVDSGPGLAPDDAQRVFERFWRADKSRTRESGGSGLGMSIVASLVRAHGGAVRFDSSVEQGSTVTVWLPLGTA